MKKIYFKKILTASLISLFFVQILYTVVFEPTVADAISDDVVVTLNVTSGVAITPGADVTMAPNLGISANNAIGSSAWTVKTNSSTGYVLAVKADASPALRITATPSSNFADYTETTDMVPEQWSVASGAKEFGYSAYGANTLTSTWGTAATCGSGGIPSTSQFYLGFKTTDNTIASSNTVTSTTGTTTNICFSAEQKDIYAPSGTYNTTITATASAT